MTVLAGDDELLAFLHHKPHDRSSIGGDMAKAYTREPGARVGSFDHCAKVSLYSFPLGYPPTSGPRETGRGQGISRFALLLSAPTA